MSDVTEIAVAGDALTRHAHLTFAAGEDATVRAFGETAAAAGYRVDGGRVLDPDGHAIEVVRGPES